LNGWNWTNFQSGIEAVKKKEMLDLAIVNSGFWLYAEQQGLVIPFRVADYFRVMYVVVKQQIAPYLKKKRESAQFVYKLRISGLYAFAYGDDQANKEEVISLLEGIFRTWEPDYIDFRHL